jgi:hypothetical protein
MAESTRYKTYNNVIDTLEQLGTNHYQIKTVSKGDIWEMDLEKNTLYPLMHINFLNVQASKSQMIYNFQVFVMDLVEEDESNEQDVLSDTLQICTDIIATFKSGESLYLYNAEHGEEARYFVDDDFTIEPFTERFDNSVTGFVFEIPIIIEQPYDSCFIPQPTTSIIK